MKQTTNRTRAPQVTVVLDSGSHINAAIEPPAEPDGSDRLLGDSTE